MTIQVHFCDFPTGFDPNNNLLINSLRYIINIESIIVDNPEDADIIFVTVYGRNHHEVINKYGSRCILWLGENIRPNKYDCRFSLSLDYHSYHGKNLRLPLWYFEIDWYDTGLGVVAKSEVNARLVEASNLTLGDLEDRDFCITIFNNPEGERILLYQLLNSYKPIKGYGRPFGNWFATNESYREKITKLTNFRFNLCLENSYHPGYYTEKCFHAKLAQVCPIYKADPYVSTDFNPKSFVNLYNFETAEECCNSIIELENNPQLILDIIHRPLLPHMPSLDKFYDFLRFSVFKILSS